VLPSLAGEAEQWLRSRAVDGWSDGALVHALQDWYRITDGREVMRLLAIARETQAALRWQREHGESRR
jgi:hypothetical protein